MCSTPVRCWVDSRALGKIPSCLPPPSVHGHWPVVAIIRSMTGETLVTAKCTAPNVLVVPHAGRFCAASIHAPVCYCQQRLRRLGLQRVLQFGDAELLKRVFTSGLL